MSVINTNITSLISQQNLNKSQSALTTAMQRLSSGSRINSAKDDAAGQAIANRMSASITGLTQAQRNANDGISVAQTAEGALNQINDNLQRIRELTVQSQNGTNSAEDLKSIQAEIDQRLGEIDRVSAQTDFNGTKVLSADQTMSIQVGSNDNESIDISLKKIDSSSLGLGGFSVSGKGLNVSDAITQTNLSATPKNVDFSGITAAQLKSMGVSSSADITLHNVQDKSGNPTANYVIKAGNDYYAASVDDATGKVLLNTASVDFKDSDNGITTAVTLNNQLIKVSNDASGAPTAYVTIQGKNYSNATINGGLANGGASATTPTDNSGIELSGAAPTAQFTGASTNSPLKALDAALKTVDNLRSDLGAIQNRFDSAISNLNTTTTNLSAARSRIQDADYSVEVANMTRAQILQQAGTSVLAQANKIPQGVLSLLQ